ncbi:BSD domain-containing protein 1 [Coemansia interrupta]|uniref:BSD domain-containing protein 1 n=1 Tax=Coemansia interrupta TaxID=1126814 RepID=A0A9W8HJX0_9FUNG|nr:BSD domain-containing protein 1 [Coemansia interrupta]
MDGYTAQLQAEAAESEGILPQPSEPSTPQSGLPAAEDAAGSGSTADSLPSLSSMFGFAASWGKKLQTELQLDQFVDQVKKQSEEVTKAYSQDIAEFAQAVKVGAARGMDELSTRFTQIKTDIETEFRDDTGDVKPKSVDPDSKEGAAQDTVEATYGGKETSAQQEKGIFGGLGKHFQVDALREQQAKAKRMMNKLGTDLEDLLRDAIVIEAPGSASTEEQRTAARKIIYDRRMAQLAAIQESEDTYLSDPSTLPEFSEFEPTYDFAQNKSQIEELLSNGSAVAEMKKRLVPGSVSEKEFWRRYFFRAWMVDQEEARRKKLVEAAVAATTEEEFSWDADEDDKDKEGADKAPATTTTDVRLTKASSDAPKAALNAESVANNKNDGTSTASPAHTSKDAQTGASTSNAKTDDKVDTNTVAATTTNDNTNADADAEGWDEWE